MAQLTAPSPEVPVTLWQERWGKLAGTLLRDPTLGLGLISSILFVVLFVATPLVQVIVQAFFDSRTGDPSLEYFRRYLDPVYRGHQWRVLWNTLIMGSCTALGGTALGLIFALTLARCRVPGQRWLHYLSLLPTVSPPFAIAIAAILLFGRSGLVTRQWLGIQFRPGVNDIYGLDGIIFVQIITFFPVAYLILRALLERMDAAMEEAAMNMGASCWQVLTTVIFPLLIPGLAGSVLLLFVESLADLGNPLLLGGNAMVLSSEIFLAVNGQYDQQRGAAFSLMLLLPTLLVFLLQRYWVSQRSYISVTGKPSAGQIAITEPWIRWPLVILTGLGSLLILALYGSILVGSITRLWGIDYSLDWQHYRAAFNRGLTPILATTFLSVAATPLAVLMGILIAYLVVRKNFWGKQSLDFVSNLGAAVPGTILGIGYILAFIRPPLLVVVGATVILAWYATWSVLAQRCWGVLLLGSLLGALLRWVGPSLSYELYVGGIGGLLMAMGGVVGWHSRLWKGGLLAAVGLYLELAVVEPFVTEPIGVWGRTLGGDMAKLLTSVQAMIGVIFQLPLTLVGFVLLGVVALALRAEARLLGRLHLGLVAVSLGLAFGLIFAGEPLALVGTPYIVIAAYAVRSLPTSVRAGMAALQQIDPSIEEASINLGADTQTTFRRVTVPLIVPALLAGAIFAFARHMTSLSAIIFLTTPRWPILTAWILSEVEQGGMSTAAAYSMILIALVFGAILLMTAFAGQQLRQLGGGLDLTMGGG
ncbi:MAG: iron ABC transporter permease [Thermostichus sp. DG_1_6_bins_120]